MADDWKTVSLLDVADYKNGLAMQKYRPSGNDEGLPVLKIRELGQESCGGDAERCRSDIDESVTVHDGDLIFSWSGTLLLKFWAGGDAGLNQHLFKVTSATYPSWFYYAWTKHHLARFIMLAKDRATTMGHIKRSALAESEVLLPPEDELIRQTGMMQPIADQLIANKVEARKLAALRNALLPKLMSGEIDVSDVDLKQLNSHLAECFYLILLWVSLFGLPLKGLADIAVLAGRVSARPWVKYLVKERRSGRCSWRWFPMNNITYKRGADLTREMLNDFRAYLTPSGYEGLVRKAKERVEEFGVVTCIASIHAVDNGDILQKQYFLGGDEDCVMFELNACMCGVDSL